MMAPQASLISGDRLHLHHGPIDLIIGASKEDRGVCYQTATRRFENILSGLVEELPDLRRPLSSDTYFNGPVAKRMQEAVKPYDTLFVTPMAAVAGAVADEVLAAMVDLHQPSKAYVNNGGDIAVHLRREETINIASPAGKITISAQDNIGGIATSGWGGRSQSRGIADAVSVLAPSAASADVAATLIANAVDLPQHQAITRVPASEISPDSDLGDLPVTVEVRALTHSELEAALSNGEDFARPLLRHGLIRQAVLSLQGSFRTVEPHDAMPFKGTLAHA